MTSILVEIPNSFAEGVWISIGIANYSLPIFVQNIVSSKITIINSHI